MSLDAAASSPAQASNRRLSTRNSLWTALGLSALALAWRIVDLNRFAT